MFFAKNLKQIRKKSGLSQDKLAAKLGISRTTITNYEGGVSTPDYKVLLQIASIFKVSIDDLLSRNMTTEQISSDSDAAERVSHRHSMHELNEPDSIYQASDKCELCLQKDITIKALQDNISGLKKILDQFSDNQKQLYKIIDSLREENTALKSRLQSSNK